MSWRGPPPPQAPERNRFREIGTLLVAFILTYFLGKLAIEPIKSAPAIAQIAVFAVIYIVLYVLIWRLGRIYQERFS